MEKRKTTATIGSFRPEIPFVLAPLAGISDAPMRRICSDLGASLTYTEMISGKGLMYGDRNTEKLLHVYEDEGPVAVQIFGSDTDVISFAAEKLSDRNFAVFDLNMGCPVPKVVKNGEGSALLRDPELAGRIVEAAVRAAGKPVTAKIRIGWDDASINAVEVAKILEQAGASAIAVHGRTREQFYQGRADWSMIRKVKESIGIPVIGNGDVFSADDAFRMMEETGCDMVMIARGALGNPWIFRELKARWEGREIPEPAGKEEKSEILLRHFNDLMEIKGAYAAVREMRKFVGWYIKGMPGAAGFRREINQITDPSALEEKIRSLAL